MTVAGWSSGWVVAASLLSCTGSSSPPSAPPPTVAVEPASPAPPSEPDAPELEPPEPAPDTLVGRLHLTKGAQPVVDGVLLPTAAFETRLGKDWRDVVVDRRVRVSGRREDHHCDPRAQCMSGGVIPLLTDIVEVALCRGDEPAVTGKLATVDCPVSEAQRAACLEACAKQSDGCDAAAQPKAPTSAGGRPDPSALRRCGCAKVSCEQGCEDHGMAVFHCQ